MGWCESADLGDFLSCAKIMESGIFVGKLGFSGDFSKIPEVLFELILENY